MKKNLLLTFLSVAMLSVIGAVVGNLVFSLNTRNNSGKQNKDLADMLGSRVELGPCIDTQLFVFFFADQNSDQGSMVPAARGCRCSYTVNGVEYVPVQTVLQERCDEYDSKNNR